MTGMIKNAIFWTVAMAMAHSTLAVDCNLDCPVDAPCVMGKADFSIHHSLGALDADDVSHDSMHCDCPPGWTGLLCDHKFETCGSDEACYHGGECIMSGSDVFGNHQLMCDCTNAVGGIDGKTKYVGKYCETPFEQMCDDDGERFCVNGGDCNPDFETDGQPCLCAEGWEGYHCEFKTGTVPECTLGCQNGGQCVVGVVSPAEAQALHHIWNYEESQSHMRCVCPPDFAGPLCQATSEKCGDGDDEGVHECYHGGTCVTTTIQSTNGDQTTEHHCDCTTASDGRDHRYAGEFCQFESEVFCSSQDDNFFCVNGGKCTSNRLEGCDCPAGFEGFKCEFRSSTTAQEETQADAKAATQPEPCGELHCLNGGTCDEREFVTEDGSRGSEVYCDCTKAFDETHLYDGDQCQYKSTAICPTETSNNLSSLEGVPFCVTGGRCLDDGTCECQDGWKGIHCEIHTLEDKEDTHPTCGDDGNVCLNGGECAEVHVLHSDGSTAIMNHCECGNAFDETHLFAGTSCQHASTTLCTAPTDDTSLRGAHFCTNHGTCRANPLQGCDCPFGFDGFHCEIEVIKEAVNGEAVDDNQNETGLDTVTCGEYTCYNGGSCATTYVLDADGNHQELKHCDCSTAVTDDAAFAGDECLYESSVFCATITNEDGTSSMDTNLFCVNGGECQENVHLGCKCPWGWTGLKCEWPISNEDLLDDGDQTDQVEPCGDSFCYNGGTCNPTQEVDDNGNSQEVFSCDCSTAMDEHHLYGGPTCQFRSTSICKEGPNGLAGSLFCVNDGICDDNDPTKDCECPPGWTGPMCDLEVEDDQHAEHGEECGDDYCYNGGACVTTKIISKDGSETVSYHCDCMMAFDEENLYAGPSCEHKSSTLCTAPTQDDSLQGARFCVNGGTCSANPLQGCDCPPQWTGLSCEFEVDAQTVQDNIDEDGAVEECGEYVCLNGGHCVTTKVTSADGTEQDTQYCDCSTAISDTHVFAGDQCQHKSTSFCTSPPTGSEDLSGLVFCVNNGECNRENIHLGCECPQGFDGLHCEYESSGSEDGVDNGGSSGGNGGDNGDSSTCHLICQNGGQCAKGAKDLGQLESTVEGVSHLNQTYDEEHFEHCVCPDGFTGLTCDHKVEVCGDNEHFCLHGSVCVSNRNSHTCDCSKADETIGDGDQPTNFAGDSCQHPATDICVEQGNDSLPAKPLYFCVNQGRCKDYVSYDDEDPGCECTGDWKGPHCEVSTASAATTPDTFKNVESRGVEIFLIILLAVLGTIPLMVLLAWIIRKRRHNNIQDDSSDGPPKSCMYFRRRKMMYDHAASENNISARHLSAQGRSPRDSYASSSDPMAAGMALPPDTEPFQDEPTIQPYRDEPAYKDEPVLVHIGPPRDEDGNELHSVDFI